MIRTAYPEEEKAMDGLLETLQNMKRSRRGLQICPQCGSTSIQGSTLLDGIIFPKRHVCRKCGYSGYLVIEGDNSREEDGSQRT